MDKINKVWAVKQYTGCESGCSFVNRLYTSKEDAEECASWLRGAWVEEYRLDKAIVKEHEIITTLKQFPDGVIEVDQVVTKPSGMIIHSDRVGEPHKAFDSHARIHDFVESISFHYCEGGKEDELENVKMRAEKEARAAMQEYLDSQELEEG